MPYLSFKTNFVTIGWYITEILGGPTDPLGKRRSKIWVGKRKVKSSIVAFDITLTLFFF